MKAIPTVQFSSVNFAENLVINRDVDTSGTLILEAP